MRLMLEKMGYSVLEAGNGADGEAMYKKEKPSLVLMDIILPGEHGLDAIEGILDSDPDARIIAFSGIYQESVVMEALEKGARDFIAKPFSLDEMLATINEHIA